MPFLSLSVDRGGKQILPYELIRAGNRLVDKGRLRGV